MKRKLSVFALGVFCITFVMLSCTKKKGSDTSVAVGLMLLQQQGASKYGGTSSPGDTYSLTLGTSTFTLSNTTVGMEATGTVSSLSTGFKKLVPTTYKANSSSTATSVTGYFLYALDAPGIGVLLSPVFSGSASSPTFVTNSGSNRVSTFASVGDCNISGTYNFITAGFGTSQESRYGAVTVTGTTSTTASFSAGSEKYTKNGTSTGNSISTSGTCSSGEITFSSTIKGFASQAGGFILDMGTGQGGIAALKQNSITASTVLSKTYAVIVSNSSSTGDNIFPAKLTCNGTSCIGAQYSNVETGSTSSNTVTITFGTPSNGLMTGSLTTSTLNQPLAAVATEYNGKVIIFLTNCQSSTACSNVGERSTAVMVSL